MKLPEVDRYLDDRQRKGFNAILVNLLEHFGGAARRNAYGHEPFTRPGDFGKPNKAYFDHVERIVEKAHARGMLVLLAPVYLGFDGGDDGWWREMHTAGPQALRAYGRFVGRRYQRFDNVLWVQGGDFDPPESERALVEAVAQGIRSVDRKLQTFHGKRGTAALAYWDPRPTWIDVNTIYTEESTVVAHARAEHRRSTTPFFLLEARYENEHGTKAVTVRQQAYHAILAGGGGSVMGNNPVWAFGSGWRSALDSGGAIGMSRLGNLFRSLHWWKLRPDTRNELIAKGIGWGTEQAVAARTADRALAVIYVPSPRKITIDLSRLRGRAIRASWYDPVSGRSRALAGSPFRALGRRSLVTPARNAGGDGDFVLLLRSVEPHAA